MISRERIKEIEALMELHPPPDKAGDLDFSKCKTKEEELRYWVSVCAKYLGITTLEMAEYYKVFFFEKYGSNSKIIVDLLDSIIIEQETRH